ncbi:MAG: YggS family pyridoxal phosphate enzyme, partial [Oscillospiraceae bacterium]|nr:YggS family pyridoxal phosphate enzyme [Oscillospiraceae bacterium]
MSIAENIQAIRARMDRAAREAGRDPAEILLVGASKMNGAAACRAAIAAGIDALGENRVQEMTAKLEEHAYDGAPLHFIGRLQRNKVRQVVGTASLIHSAGSLALLEEIQRQAEKRALVQDVLLEVNIGGEESKGGFAPEDLYAAAETAGGFQNVRVLGLMTIPPAEREPHGNFPYFLKVSQLYVDISRNL